MDKGTFIVECLPHFHKEARSGNMKTKTFILKVLKFIEAILFLAIVLIVVIKK